MSAKIDLTGKVFGKLTVLREDGVRTSPNGSRTLLWRCVCECGNETVVGASNLRTGATKSCGCGMHRNKGRSLAFPGKPTWLNDVWQSYIKGARERRLAFELTVEQVESLVVQPCTYCGAEPRNGIDRRDNSVGYILSNCVPCCSICNTMKMAMDADAFVAHAKRIAGHDPS